MTRLLGDYAELQALARERLPRVALILGSGLSDIADRLEDAVELPFAQVSGLESPGVAGHRGVLQLGRWANVPVLVFAGRLHYYEGHPWERVVQPVHIAHELGASMLIATNAAGGIRADLNSGDLLALHGHLDCTKPGWWRGESMIRSDTYSPRLLDALRQLGLPTGVYAQYTGPCYETPAEIRAVRTCGADAVGMSTAREIEAAHALGLECAAISCITNQAGGWSGEPIHHEEVLEVGRRVKEKMVRFLEAFINRATEPINREIS
jgi:purine-nucleoside phosphorylase